MNSSNVSGMNLTTSCIQQSLIFPVLPLGKIKKTNKLKSIQNEFVSRPYPVHIGQIRYSRSHSYTQIQSPSRKNWNLHSTSRPIRTYHFLQVKTMQRGLCCYSVSRTSFQKIMRNYSIVSHFLHSYCWIYSHGYSGYCSNDH